MGLLELNRKTSVGEADYPLRAYRLHLALQLDFDDEMPAAAQRRVALRVLQELIENLTEEELAMVQAKEPVVTEWKKPKDLDLRVIKSAHRLILEVAKRAERGRAVMAAELINETGLSAPTVGRLLRDGEPAFDYLKRFIRVSPHGRTKALDLTAEGRVLASKIRAGTVPA